MVKCAECDKNAYFGVEMKKPTHCKTHKLDHMFDIKNKRCIEPECIKQPAYNFSGLKSGLYCKIHAKQNMINVLSKRCLESDCPKRSSYNLPGIKTPLYCKTHAKEDMIDITNKRCIEPECTILPNYNISGSSKPLYCQTHAKDNMIDIKNKRCIEPECNKQPAYNIPGLKTAVYCQTHAKQGMIDVKHKRCIEEGCIKHPNYNAPGLKNALYCQTHAKDGMINIKDKLCKTCDYTRVNPKYFPNCARCHFYLNPDDPRIRNYKTKEHAFMLPLSEKYPNMILDKMVSGGCSKRRPDGLLDCLTHCIIIEIGEDQHVSYSNVCDNRRTMELFTDLGNRPLVFIRLNPDSYISEDGTRVGSIFSLSKSGTLSVNQSAFISRLSVLEAHILKSIAVIPTRDLSYVKLFYTE